MQAVPASGPLKASLPATSNDSVLPPLCTPRRRLVGELSRCDAIAVATAFTEWVHRSFAPLQALQQCNNYVSWLCAAP
jgi:hypothetical protein